jgi:integrase
VARIRAKLAKEGDTLMPKTVSLRPKRLPSRDGKEWCVNVPAVLSSTGKRQRLFFATEREADVESELLKTRKINFGHSLSSLDPSRIAEAGACYRRLELEAPGVTLSDAVSEFLERYRARTASVPMATLWDAFITSRSKPGYRQDLRSAFTRLEPLAALIASEVTAQDIITALDVAKFPPAYRKAVLCYLRAAFNFGIPRWLRQNPIEGMEFPKVVRDGVETIAPDRVERLLIDALLNDLELSPSRILEFFAGVRPDNEEGEITQMLWSDIDLRAKEHHVTIRPTIAKKDRKRWADLSANGLAWFDAYAAAGGKMEGLIVPFSASTLRRKRRLNAMSAGLQEWPQQGARHTWASCWLREHGDINKLMLQGGWNSVDVVWSHYYQAVTPATAAAFWNIFPPLTEERRIVAFA